MTELGSMHVCNPNSNAQKVPKVNWVLPKTVKISQARVSGLRIVVYTSRRFDSFAYENFTRVVNTVKI